MDFIKVAAACPVTKVGDTDFMALEAKQRQLGIID